MNSIVIKNRERGLGVRATNFDGPSTSPFPNFLENAIIHFKLRDFNGENYTYPIFLADDAHTGVDMESPFGSSGTKSFTELATVSRRDT